MSSKTSTKPKKSKAQEKPEQSEVKAKVTTAPEPQPESAPEPVSAHEQDHDHEQKHDLTLSDIKILLDALTTTILEHSNQIAELQDALARKRKPTRNSKVQIRDKQTGKTYPSKNNCYQSLLKAGELKALVDKGVFGPDPAKNTFGWYVLVREWPERFEEVQAQGDDGARGQDK